MKTWRIWLLFFAAFVAGVLAGATVMRAFDHPRVRQAMAHGALGRSVDRPQDYFLQRLDRELALTPEQHAQMEKAQRDTREQLMRVRLRIQPEWQKIIQDGRKRMEDILTPGQLPRFREIMNRQPAHGHGQPSGQGTRTPRPDPADTNAPPPRAEPAAQPI